jgi:uncharacterized protein YbjT (DUF2867 family)
MILVTGATGNAGGALVRTRGASGWLLRVRLVAGVFG